MKTSFLQDRAATIGGKLAEYLQNGKIPSEQDVAFFNKCMSELTDRVPAHAMRLLAIDLNERINKAKADRALWLKGRAEALKAADERKAAKAKAIAQAKAKAKGNWKSRKMVKAVVAEIKDRRAVYTPPTGTSSQGLPFVVELPLEWSKEEVNA